MDPLREGYVLRSAVPADPMVVGIAAGPADDCKAGQPGEEFSATDRVPVATFGVILSKVDATFGPIARGDLLIASPTPGRAMRAAHPKAGTILGKALEPLVEGTGLIKVLVMMR